VSLPPPLETYPTERLANGELPVLWPAPPFTAVDQHGRRITEQDLRGHVWVADFIFTRCTSACPIMTAKMILVQKATPHAEVRFVSFSVDPDHDTPEVLKQYASIWKGDESRWLLLSTDRKMLYHTAAGMRVAIMPTDDQADPVLHSSLFLLVDQQGQVRRVYNSSLDSDLHQLPADIALLTHGEKQAAFPTSNSNEQSSNTGEQLFLALGCAGCHQQTQIAPPLAGVFSGEVTLADGRTIIADEAYLRESILDPTAKVVAGYLQLMPTYRNHLTEAQVDALVTYLCTLGGKHTSNQVSHIAAALPSAASTVEIDPVCGMEIPVNKETVHAEHDGKSYHFCSDHCRLVFMKNPAKYATR